MCPFVNFVNVGGLNFKRTEEDCIKILKERNYGWWWHYNVSGLDSERYEQMQELVAAARHEKPMLVSLDIAGFLKSVEYK